MDHSLVEALKELLFGREAQTQDDISAALVKKGFDVNQSKISRLLRKLGAIKVENTKGHTVYSLPREPSPPTLKTELRELILDVVANEAMVVIYTSPGSASMVARMLDYAQIDTDILGTVAGDDTIFVAPKSIKETKALKDEIKALFLG